MKRRSLLTWLGLGWISSLIPVAIAACSPDKSKTTSVQGSPTTPANSPNAEGFYTIGTVAQLDNLGQIQTTLATDKVVVIRDPANPNALFAVNPSCTHRGCTVAWSKAEKQFACPCHGSDFAPDGKVLSKPANKPLKTYQVKIAGDMVLVKAT